MGKMWKYLLVWPKSGVEMIICVWEAQNLLCVGGSLRLAQTGPCWGSGIKSP